jgi:AhpD family alkylhydroperoxidase
MNNPFPTDRIQLYELAHKPVAALLRLEGSIELDRDLHHLVSLRASQINGCAACIDMHWKDARAAGESEERLYSLDCWRESPLYSERERAALALCEAMTLISDGHVPDEIWDRAREALDEPELAHLVFAIATINVFNRLNITVRTEPGHYEAGMLEKLEAA